MKSEKFILSKPWQLGAFFKLTLMSAMLMLLVSGANAQCPLACNNLVQVSIDDDCVVVITPDMMLEGQGVLPTCTYSIQILNANGQPRTGPAVNTVTVADIGKTLTVRVFLGANSCWGSIKIEDKLAPRVECRPLRRVACWDPAFDPNTPLPKPVATDNCGPVSPDKVLLVSDKTVDMPCTSELRARRILCYQASDASNNVSAICCDTIDYVRITLADIKFPKSYDGSPGNRPHFSCDGSWPWGGFNWNPLTRRYEKSYVTNATGIVLTNQGSWDLDGDGYPDPNESGAPYVPNALNITNFVLGYMVSPTPVGTATVPSCAANAKIGYDLADGPWRTACDGGNGMLDARIDTIYSPLSIGNTICKINVTYSDTEIPICDNGFKILRQWSIIEWCTGAIATKYQIIKVVDDKGPLVSIPTEADVTIAACQANFTVSAIISADPYSCTGTWLAEIPTILYDCDDSDLEYTVQFALSDAQGNAPPAGGPYFFVRGETRSTLLTTGPNRGRWQLTNLPMGCSWIKYSVKDACGNVTEAFTEIRVIDRTPPVAVCDEFTVVTLSTNGIGRVFAKTFDDGSHDNCSDVGFEVARMQGETSCNIPANIFGPFVDFCCADLTKIVVDANRDGVINALDRGHIQVILKVWDDANGDGKFNDLVVNGRRDNFNTCMVIIKVEDKTPPIITCPRDITIDCGADTAATVIALQGKEFSIPVLSSTPLSVPYYTDNCPNATMSWVNVTNIDNCGQGTIRRTFTVYATPSTPANAAIDRASCTQTITIRNTRPYNGPVLESTNPVVWKNLGPKPAIPGCLGADTDPSKTGLPELGETDCSQVAYTYEDQVFNFVEDVCYKILRKWTVIDWCKFAPNRNPQGQVYPTVPTLGVNMWTYTQTIKVSDETDPVIITSQNPNRTFNVTGPNCGGSIELVENATDCSPAATASLKWTYLVDLFNDGNIINTPLASSNNNALRGNTNDASGAYPVGTHKVTWTVEDQCGNQTVKEYTFIVRDDKKPTPYCLGSLTTVIMPVQGFVELWAADYDKGSTDNCNFPLTPAGPCKLYFTFNGMSPVRTKLTQVHFFKGNGSNATETEYQAGLAQKWLPSTCTSGMYFDCDDAKDGPKDINVSVWDQSWNTDFCTVTIDIQANADACTGSRIAGSISRSQTEMIKDVHVTLRNINNNESKLAVTNTQGNFEFFGMVNGSDYAVVPSKEDDYLNGVSTLDLVLIQRHVLNINKFDSPYKYLAGDVNKDNKLTASDLVELRKLILGIYEKLPNNKSWRFIDKTAVFTDITNPWNAAETITLNDFASTNANNHFTAVKVGDINSSATVNANGIVDNRTKKSLTFKADDINFVKGDEVIVNITSENFAQIAGAQGSVTFDAAAMELKNVLPGALKVSGDNFNTKQAANGKIGFSWNEVKGQSFDKKEILFTIVFKAITNQQLSQVMNITSDVTPSEAYTQNLEILNLNMSFNGRAKEVFALGQNNPNPFTDKTTIAFTLPVAGEATINIYDLTGKVIRKISNTFPKGHSEIVIKAEDLNTTGVLFYELESQGFKSTKKMIYLR